MKQELISVLIPARNSENTIEACLNSAASQTYKNYEIVVVNNNSSDRTKDIILEFQKKNKNIRYVFEKQAGRGAARNAGISASKGR